MLVTEEIVSQSLLDVPRGSWKNKTLRENKVVWRMYEGQERYCSLWLNAILHFMATVRNMFL